MSNRKPIPTSVRFEVFKRDSFTCQYCGKKAPDVILHVDHVSPVSAGGDNDFLNLVTSCADCNLGKSDRLLSDNSVIEKQRAQLAELNERREQLEMMLEWSSSLREMDNSIADKVADEWSNLMGKRYVLNESGIEDVRKLLRKFGVDEVLAAMRTAIDKYCVLVEGGKYSPESVDEAFQKVGAIAAMNRKPKSERDLYYIRGILRKRLHYLNENYMWVILKQALAAGIDSSDMIDVAKASSSWSNWRDSMTDLMSSYENA